jgi:hypothetical protein
MENIDQYDDRNDEQPEPMPEAYEDLPYENHEQTLSYEYDQYEDLENKIQPVNDDEYAEQSNQLNDWEEE